MAQKENICPGGAAVKARKADGLSSLRRLPCVRQEAPLRSGARQLEMALRLTARGEIYVDPEFRDLHSQAESRDLLKAS